VIDQTVVIQTDGLLVVPFCKVSITEFQSGNGNHLGFNTIFKQLQGDKLGERSTKTVTVNFDRVVRLKGLEPLYFFEDLRVDTVDSSVDAAVNTAVTLGPSSVSCEIHVIVHVCIRLTIGSTHHDINGFPVVMVSRVASDVVILPVESFGVLESLSNTIEVPQIEVWHRTVRV